MPWALRKERGRRKISEILLALPQKHDNIVLCGASTFAEAAPGQVSACSLKYWGSAAAKALADK
jgi:hypothetical protein